MQTLLSRSQMSARSLLVRAFGRLEGHPRLDSPRSMPDGASAVSTGQLTVAGTRLAGEPVRHGRPTLVWRVVEVEDGRLEWRVVEDEHVQVLNAGATPLQSAPVATGLEGVAA